VRVALDTNILVYAEGIDGPARRMAALDAIAARAADEIILPVQALGELFRVLTRKARLAPAEAQRVVESWSDGYALAATSPEVLHDAMTLSARHRLAIWDAIILAAAAQAECRLLLTEDMQDGFAWRGVTVRNPFARPG
jgi:predicted nucleic acid-binding protein